MAVDIFCSFICFIIFKYRSKKIIKEIYEETNSSKDQLPGILRTDPMSKLFRLAPGDICKITRNSERCGEYVYYRICQ